jgi:hypothetical protein
MTTKKEMEAPSASAHQRGKICGGAARYISTPVNGRWRDGHGELLYPSVVLWNLLKGKGSGR